jgi:uncharacterized protein YceH (UPF0502 family)
MGKNVESDVKKELENLKKRVDDLEKRLEKHKHQPA